MPREASQTYDGYYHYLPVNDAMMRWGVYLTGCGRGVIHPGQTYPPDQHPDVYQFNWDRGRTLPEFQAIFITDGRGEIEFEDTGPLRIESGTLILLRPDVWHRYHPDSKTGWTERWISFNGATIHQLMDDRQIDATHPLRQPGRTKTIARAFDQLLELVHRHPTQNSIILSMRAMNLLAEVCDAYVNPAHQPQHGETLDNASTNDELVNQAIQQIWTYSHRQLSVSSLAEILSVNRRVLERRFRAATGHSLLDEIMRCRLGRARRLVDETNLPIKTAAYLSGFTSYERLRVVFTQRYGLSPQEYRDRNQFRQ